MNRQHNTAPVATEQAQAVRIPRGEADYALMNRIMDLSCKATHASAKANSDDGHAGTEAMGQYLDLTRELWTLIANKQTALTASPEAAPAAPLLMQDENSGRDGRRYNEWHASRPDARLNAREAAAATPAAPSAVTDAMIDAYLKANDAYWKRTDELPKSGVKWRNGTPREATRESLHAALAQPAPVQAGAQQAVSLDSIEQYRMQMAGISTAAMGYWKECESIHPDYDTLALRDVAKLYAKYDTLHKAADRLALIDWVAQRWHAEVANRPMVNVHRRSLDDTWRQMLRHLGVDDRARLGPTHDDLRADISTKEWEAMNGKATPVQQDAPAPSMVGDAVAAVPSSEAMDALRRLERAVDMHLGRSAWTQTTSLKGFGYSEQVHKELFAAHDAARAAISGQKPAEGEKG